GRPALSAGAEALRIAAIASASLTAAVVLGGLAVVVRVRRRRIAGGRARTRVVVASAHDRAPLPGRAAAALPPARGDVSAHSCDDATTHVVTGRVVRPSRDGRWS